MNREELQRVRDRALDLAKSAGPAKLLLMRAWGDLASAADRLDAMFAREERRPVSNAPDPNFEELELEEETDDDDDSLTSSVV